MVVADLKKIVEDNGGSFSSKVTDECTHLVSTQKEVDNNGTKSECNFYTSCA